ncbi:MAG TPA: PTS sugar transporter subunit IIB [Gemmatimonadales bacterium]|nr:PTS sugar transporter subunit IIB [Gemmatimonadales bacterium]
MSIVLYRIDDRLVHGQVVVGWGKPLNVRFIVLVDDTVAASEWERELYRMGVPAEIDLYFAGVSEAARQLPGWRAERRNGIVLTGDIATMLALADAAPPIERVNLGGIHHRPGRSQRLPYVYLSDEELQLLEALAKRGAEVTAQDLPNMAPVALELLR